MRKWLSSTEEFAQRYTWVLLALFFVLVIYGIWIGVSDPFGVKRWERKTQSLTAQIHEGISIGEARQLLGKHGIRFEEKVAEEDVDQTIEGERYTQRVGDRLIDGSTSTIDGGCTDTFSMRMSFAADGKMRSRRIRRRTNDCL